MPDTSISSDDAAEKAYAEASQAVAVTGKPAAAKRTAKALKPAEPLAEISAPAPVEAAPEAEPVAAEAVLPVATTPLAAPAAEAAEIISLPALKKLAKVKQTASPKPAAKPPVTTAKAAKPVVRQTPEIKKIPVIKPFITTNPKESTMTTKTTKITDSFKSLAADAQEKAKSAFEKGSTLVGETGDFAKGNVAAVVESGKILANGLQEMGTTFVTDAKDTFGTLQADLKELATAKSPTDLIEIQNGQLQRNIDRAVAYNSKASESVLKLANDTMAPISGRISLAIQKIRSAA